ncbi:hypothetical protein GDO81_007729 [Engystomops pustulosus]|uniref:Uncharacterized protein n=1 Tax=Engystomops pustulosus TaxID=76066 RepID=A0AAV7C9F8_ENGPU|nr:hypothetical protein GDO81_007729 [Engystomops pustulosus]
MVEQPLYPFRHQGPVTVATLYPHSCILTNALSLNLCPRSQLYQFCYIPFTLWSPPNCPALPCLSFSRPPHSASL